jgi:tetratricopeptide (TPR) repeat protein
MTNMKIKILLSCAMLISTIALPCGNEYGHKLNGTKLHSRYFYLTPYHLKFDTSQLEKKIVELKTKYEKELKKAGGQNSLKTDKFQSDIALALMKLGQTSKAKNILVPLVQRNPEEYTMAANLGTVYELSGKLDSALKYISRGLELNSKSHRGSEWIHVELLKAKIKRKRNKEHIILNPILSQKLLESKFDSAKTYRGGSMVLGSIYYQARTRAAFTPAPNEVMSNLLLSAGVFAQKHDTYENALLAFAYARKYAKGWGQRTKAETKIRKLNQLRNKLSRDKEIGDMFFHTIERAQISPQFLLMGLDEVAESLDSVNVIENRHQTKVDSLEAELAKEKSKIAPTNSFPDEELEKDTSKIPFVLMIIVLAFSTIFFWRRSTKRKIK